ncbi:retrovirus-related pol polyprotein from transposon TNT 1-94 [Tanacetum coccineum]
MKLATKRSLTETHNSHTSGSSTDEGTGRKPGVPDVPTYESDDEQISWKSSDEDEDDEVGMNEDDEGNDDDDDDANNSDDDDDDDADNQDNDDQDDDDQEDDDQNNEDKDDVNEHTDSENDGDDFVHPKLSTQDQEVRHNEEESDEEIQGTNVEEEELDEEETNDEDEANELYMDVNVNLEGRDIKMTDAPRIIVQTTQVIEDTHVIITPVNPKAQQQSSSMSYGFVFNMLNPSPNTSIDFIFNLNTELTLLIDVSVTTIAEPPLLSTTTLPLPPTPLITHLRQTPIPTPATAPSSSLQDLPNFGSLFRFDHRLKTLETNFSKLKQTNQFAVAVSSILGIVDAYLANKMHEAFKIVDQVKEQVKAYVSKILPKIEKTVNEQLKAEVLTRSSNESKTFYAVAANLSELELKNILIDKMESNKCQDKEDKDEEPSARSNRGSKRRKMGKEPESSSAPKEKTSKTTGKSTKGSKSHQKSVDESAQAEEPMQTAKDLEEPAHQEFKTGVIKDQPDEETSHLPDWI